MPRHRHPITPIFSQRRKVVGAVSVGATPSTDVARVMIVGTASETDTARPIARVRPITLAAETDSAITVTRSRRRTLGIASETDTAIQVAVRLGVNIASETDSAITLSARRVKAITLAAETDTAIAFGGAFTPTQIAGLAAWWDASDSSTITASAGAVSQWNDKSGNARHLTQPSGTLQPITGTRSQYGLNVLDFDGSNDRLDASAFLYALGSMTAFAVFRVDTDPTQTVSTIFEEQTAGSSSHELTMRYSATKLNMALVENGSARYNTDAATGDPTDGGNHIGTMVDTTTGIEIGLDAATRTTAAYTRNATFSGNSFTVGANRLTGGNTPRCHNGWIAEIIIYDSNLSSTDISAVVAYLVRKWGTLSDDFGTADSLAGWVNGAWSTTAITESGGTASSGTAGAEQDAYLANDIGSVDQWVELDVTQDSVNANAGVLARCNSSTNTNYMGRYDKNTSQWQIYRRVTGTFTQLANTGVGGPAAGTYRIRLEAQTNAGNVDLRLYQVSAGVRTLKLSTTDSSASKITSGNYAGMRPTGSSGSGSIVDNFRCGAL